MKKQKRTAAELTTALDQARERNMCDAWFIRSLHPELGWTVLVSPRAYQILLVHVTDCLGCTGVDYIDTLAPNWSSVKNELLRQVSDNGTTVEYGQLCKALEDVNRARAAANIPRNIG
jgi:hypothetical protein